MNQPLRILHYDIARGAYLKPAFFQQAVRLAADAGFSHFAPYLEHMLRLPSVERACPACAYTPAQWRAFEAAARTSGVELVPHFNAIGHAQRICAAYPELAGAPGEQEVDATLPATRDWTVRGLEELCGVASGAYVLIGGDEWQAPRHRLADPSFSVARAWAGQINLACETLKRFGRTAIVWHDMPMHYPEALDLLSREALIAFWFYDEDADYPVLDMLRKLGFRTLMAPGLCDGLFSRRRQRGLICALGAAHKYRADGIFMTQWEDGRWEKLSAAIPMIGEVLRGRRAAPALTEAMSVLECLAKVPPDSRMAAAGRERLRAAMEDPAWATVPAFQRYVECVRRGDAQAEAASFAQYHHAEGPLLDRIRAPAPAPAPPASAAGPAPKPGFGVTVEEDAAAGPVLRFRNGTETFAVYPAFGATLQDWRVDDAVVIAHALPAFLARHTFPPGGYRSYTGAGGFRPIWALGTHHNPCILWQGPFQWRLLDAPSDWAGVELVRRLPHVDVRYRIRIQEEEPGFSFQADAVSQLPFAYGAFNFNLPLAMTPDDIERTSFEWEAAGAARQGRLDGQFESFFSLPSSPWLKVIKPAWTFELAVDPAQTAGFYVDWSASYLTPDVHGVYRPLRAGARVSTGWHLKAEKGRAMTSAPS